MLRQGHNTPMESAHYKNITAKQRESHRAIALAALTQVSYLVEKIAQAGSCDHESLLESIDALLDDDYIGQRHFSIGKAKLRRLLTGSEISHAKATLSHASSLITIEKKLSRQPEKLEQISQGISKIHKQIQYFSSSHHPNVHAGIAHLYGETISNINPRVIIRGKPEYLRQAHNTEQIRCLLFSGVRAAWIWRNNGGNTMRLLFGSRKLLHQLDHYEHIR